MTILLDSKIEQVGENTYQITNQIETWFVLYLTAWPLNLPYDQDDKIHQEKILSTYTIAKTQANTLALDKTIAGNPHQHPSEMYQAYKKTIDKYTDMTTTVETFLKYHGQKYQQL